MKKETLKAMTSSDRQDWATPWSFFDVATKLCIEATGQGFTLDVAAGESNKKCSHFFSEENSGLVAPWNGNAWCNPPYNDCLSWIRRAYEQSRGNEESAYISCLVPARTSERWFQDWGAKADEIRFLRGRLTFVGAPSAAPFGSALLVFSRRLCRRNGKRVYFWDHKPKSLDLPFGEPSTSTQTFIQGLESTKG